MNKAYWYFLLIVQELKMFKFKSLFRFIYDRRYRRDIQRLCRLLSGRHFKSVSRSVKLSDIHFSHDINYPNWVMNLQQEILEGKPLVPIKVIRHGGQLLVVDGNHRLLAMKTLRPPGTMVMVRELE